jgi:hypothetical protein
VLEPSFTPVGSCGAPAFHVVVPQFAKVTLAKGRAQGSSVAGGGASPTKTTAGPLAGHA